MRQLIPKFKNGMYSYPLVLGENNIIKTEDKK